jgi:uncharacterized protein (DUF427 family)
MSRRLPRGVEPVLPGPGQESVWDYPRPPRVEPSSSRIVVEIGGRLLVDTVRAVRLLETSHPPSWYLPLADCDPTMLVASARRTWCEFKGEASYFDVVAGDRRERDAAWTYERPVRGFESLVGLIALYPGRMDRCTVDGEVVRPQEGGFYGGWITADVVGPFKGGPGSAGW